MVHVFENDPRTNRERMLAGDPYVADDPDIALASARAARLAAEFSALYPVNPKAARTILEDLLGSVAPDAEIRGPIFVDYGSYITIGAGTFINYGLTALDVAPITIGRDVQMGPHVQLLTPTHPLDPQQRRDKVEAAKPIVIEDNVWIGGGAIILPGITVGENSVVGGGSVVTRDVPPNTVVAGNPARAIRHLDEAPVTTTTTPTTSTP
jgi:maltose O-acetyltransferase